MSEFEEQITDEQLESYLDNTMSPAQRTEFEQRLATDAQAARQVELYREFRARLREIFAPPEASAEDIERLLTDHSLPESQFQAGKPRAKRRTALAIGSAMAAAAVWAFVAWQWGRHPDLQPFFRPDPLAEIYRQSVAQGFRPYYFCEDDERFAMTFRQRQGVPLRLTSLPEDRRMVGLSYLGGLSRNTTAMLCYVDEHPVIVFVDRREEDQTVATTHARPDLYVHRKELGDLVMYEVTPLDSVAMLGYLQIERLEP